jgi:short-subunit dehydrogenase
MIAQASGNIVLMSSQAAFDGGGVGSAYYAATKGAILTYSRCQRTRPHHIRVNCVAPGLIDTRFHDINTPPDMRAAVRGRIPLGREGTPSDVAGAVIYLTSEPRCLPHWRNNHHQWRPDARISALRALMICAGTCYKDAYKRRNSYIAAAYGHVHTSHTRNLWRCINARDSPLLHISSPY